MSEGHLTYFSVPGDSKHRCDDCRAIVLGSRLAPILDLERRVEPGGVVPSGECPHCRALCYQMPRIRKKKAKRGKTTKTRTS